jgi:hypothetical protein
VRPYTELPGLEAIVLEESYVLAVHAEPGSVAFRVEFVLTEEHASYAPPRPGDRECFRVGQIQFLGVRHLVWDRQGSLPATDAARRVDYGHIDSFSWDSNEYRLGGDWGEMEIFAAGVSVGLDG